MFLLLCILWPNFKRENNNFVHSPTKETPKRTLYSSSTFQTIRITLDYQYLDGTTSDPLKCISAGQTVTWGGKTIVCQADDVQNPAKIAAFKGTMNNIKSYLQRFLKVLPKTEPISLRSDTDDEISIVEGTNISNSDLHFTFFSRPFYQDEYSVQSQTFRELTYNRVIQINTYLNNDHLPDTVQSENSDPNGLFFFFFGHFLRILTMSDTLIQKFHPKYDPTPYDKIICNLTKNGKNFSVLVTPYAHYFAIKHYGTAIFT